MPLSPGDKLGPYEILAPIGKGGMGEVYRAKDTKLDREVAIKVLPSALAQDPERLARFEREAKALASLNHPNIAQIYGIEDSSTGRALVMELVPGGTLTGTLPLETALNYARQIAEALEAAHDKSIVHRDLKPANIMVTPAGTVKVLDFGLAAVTQPSAASSGDPSNSPTLTMRATQAGMILGTAGYMAPEQASGQAVDKRADIWAFGVVLFEMLTGQRLFAGDSIAHILADVLRAPIDFDKLPKETPRAIRDLLKRCLDRDAKTRLRDIGEARIAIRNGGKDPESPSATPPQSRSDWVAWGVAGLLLVVLSGLAFMYFREARPPEPRIVRYQITPPEKSSIDYFKLSPDGRSLAFVAERRVWIRSLDMLQGRPLEGTEGADELFWSPDSQFIAFFARGKLNKIAASGGAVQILCNISQAHGGTWNRDGVIVLPLSLTSGLFQVSAGGGAPVPISKLGPSVSPEFLPDGQHFLYSGLGELGKPNQAGIFVGSLDGAPAIPILPAVENASYVQVGGAQGQDGYLLFRRGEALMAQRFNPRRLSLSGEASPIVGKVAGSVLWAGFSVSENGTLVYAPVGGASAVQLAWWDRSGKQVGPFGPPGVYVNFRLAPDEKRIAFSTSLTENVDVWVLDSIHGVSSRLTFDPGIDDPPMWSPDGSRVVWASSRAGTFDLYVKSANGAGPEQLLVKMGALSGWPEDWSQDGRFLLYQIPGARTGQDLWIAPQSPNASGGDRKPYPYLQTEFDEKHGRFSPDGRWVAYTSNESGRDEVYVQSLPLSGAKFQISAGGGMEPHWRKDGTELFYIAENRMLTAVPVKLARSASEPLQVGQPKRLFPVQVLDTFIVGRSYEVSNDGQRFLMRAPASGATTPPLTVVLNWQTQLK